VADHVYKFGQFLLSWSYGALESCPSAGDDWRTGVSVERGS